MKNFSKEHPELTFSIVVAVILVIAFLVSPKTGSAIVGVIILTGIIYWLLKKIRS